MTVQEFIAKCRELFAKARTVKSWPERFALAMEAATLMAELLSVFADGTDVPEAAMAPSNALLKTSMAQNADKSIGMLCEELEAQCVKIEAEGPTEYDEGVQDESTQEEGDESEAKAHSKARRGKKSHQASASMAAVSGGGRRLIDIFAPLLTSLLLKLIGG